MFKQGSLDQFKTLMRNRCHTMRLRCAAWRFKSYRADYYDYLSDLIRATAGTKTLLSIFQDDANRYASTSARGKLSTFWAQRFPHVGGDLFATWTGSLPLEDLVAIQAAQYAGAGALIQTLRQLSVVVRVTDHARQMFTQTILVGVVSLFVALASVLLIPFFTVPRLMLTFASLPAQYYGPMTQSLFSTSDWLRQFWWLTAAIVFAALWATLWSLPNLTGPLRLWLDRWGIWRLYRVVQTVRFLSLLAVLLQPRGNISVRLKESLVIQQTSASLWLSMHINTMLDRIDAGFEAIDALGTGLIDEQTWWYFTDTVRTLGLDMGLQRTCERLVSHTVNRLSAQAIVIRWGLLLCSVCIVLSIAFWHVRVFEELRQGLSLYYGN